MKLIKFPLLLLILSLAGCAAGYQSHLERERDGSLQPELKSMWRQEYRSCLRVHNLRGGAEPTFWPHRVDACKLYATRITRHTSLR